jgi:two-component system, NtrC family, sensor kinase
MSEHAAALPLPSGADPTTAEREASIEAARLGSLGQLVRGLAHEINNPLFGMLGLVELALGEIEPGTKQHERLLLVQQSGLEIKRITHALFEFARAEPDRVEVVPLEAVAAEMVELVRCTSAGNSIELREQYPDGPLPVWGSAARLGQVFLSLLVSARQALLEGGVVSVTLECEQDWAVASVAGVARTGPWLDASHEIARLYGGELTCLPSVGAGATFVLRLPLTEPE